MAKKTDEISNKNPKNHPVIDTGTDPRIAFFDQMAADWDNSEPSNHAMIAKLEQQTDRLSLKFGQNLLEVGCGTGKVTAWLAQQVEPGHVTAIDFSPRMIEKAKLKEIKAEFCCLDVCCDDLGCDLYDVILCFHCFPHFRDQSAALANFTRAMKQGGRLIIMHMAGSKQINDFHSALDGPVKGDILPATTDQWNELLANCGLQCKMLIDTDDLFFLQACE